MLSWRPLRRVLSSARYALCSNPPTSHNIACWRTFSGQQRLAQSPRQSKEVSCTESALHTVWLSVKHHNEESRARDATYNQPLPMRTCERFLPDMPPANFLRPVHLPAAVCSALHPD